MTIKDHRIKSIIKELMYSIDYYNKLYPKKPIEIKEIILELNTKEK